MDQTHRIMSFQVPADDISRAKAFYGQVFGLDVHGLPLPESDFYPAGCATAEAMAHMATAGPFSGLAAQRCHQVFHPILVIDVPSLDDALRKVEQAGGRIITPPEKLGADVLYARVSDTEGNVVGLWQDLPPEDGRSHPK